MRNRPANEEAVKRLIDFMKDLRFTIENGQHVSLPRLQETHGISKRSGSALITLGLITKIGVHEYEWNIKVVNSYRYWALKIMDHNLHKTKKEIVTPLLPEFATIANVLNNISEQLAISINKNNNRLKGMKSSDTEANLFSYEEQHHRDMVYLTGKLLPAFIERDKDPFSNCGYFNTLAHKATEAASIILDTIERRRKKDA